MATRAPISDVSTKLAPAKNVGEYPNSTAPFSFSAAARVTRPIRVYRDAAHTAAATAMTTTASHNPSRGTVSPSAMVTGSRGRIAPTRMLESPANRRSISEMNTITKPMLATTLARAGARNSGRNTSRYTAPARITAVSNANSIAQRNPTSPPAK